MESNSLIEDNNNQEVTTNTKPRFPHLKKFMGNEYEDMRMELNEMVIATNVAYEYCSIEDKPTCPWKKLIYSKMILLATLSFGVEENVLLRLRVVLRLDFLRRRPIKGFLMMNQ